MTTVNKKWYTKMILKYPNLINVFRLIMKLSYFYRNEKIYISNKSNILFAKSFIEIIKKELNKAILEKIIGHAEIVKCFDSCALGPVFGLAISKIKMPTTIKDVEIIKFQL